MQLHQREVNIVPKETNDYVTKIGYQLHDLSTYFHLRHGSTPPYGVHYSGVFANKSIEFNLMVLGGATLDDNNKATNLIRNRFRTTQSLNFNHLLNMKAVVGPIEGEIVLYDYANTFNGQPAIVLLSGRTITFTFAKTPLFVADGDRQENTDVFNIYSNVLNDISDENDGKLDFTSNHEIEDPSKYNNGGFSVESYCVGTTNNIDISGSSHHHYWQNSNDKETISSQLKSLNTTVNGNTSNNKYDYTFTVNNGLSVDIELWPPQITTNYASYYRYNDMWGTK